MLHMVKGVRLNPTDTCWSLSACVQMRTVRCIAHTEPLSPSEENAHRLRHIGLHSAADCLYFRLVVFAAVSQEIVAGHRDSIERPLQHG